MNLVKPGGERSPASMEDHSNASLFTPDGSVSESCFTGTPPPDTAQSPGELMAARRLDPGSTPELMVARRLEPGSTPELMAVRRLEPGSTAELMAVRRDSEFSQRRASPGEVRKEDWQGEVLRPSPPSFTRISPSNEGPSLPSEMDSQSPRPLVIAEGEEMSELRIS